MKISNGISMFLAQGSGSLTRRSSLLGGSRTILMGAQSGWACHLCAGATDLKSNWNGSSEARSRPQKFEPCPD
jgi:hypothetical protein